MTERSIAAKLPEPLWFDLKDALARRNLSVRDWVNEQAETMVRESTQEAGMHRAGESSA